MFTYASRTFIPQVKKAAGKAMKVTKTISGIMRNVVGLKELKRRIKASAIALYGAISLRFTGARKALHESRDGQPCALHVPTG